MKKFYVLNIRLISETRKGSDAYIQLFNKLHSEKIFINGHGDREIATRRILDFKFEDESYITGKIFTFSKLENSDWINITNMENTEIEIPENIHPNFKENDFVFIPSAHRLCIPKNPKVSLVATYKYFLEALNKIVDEGEMVNVSIEQSKDIFEQIIKAKSIRKLEIKISPTNDDINKEAEEFMDQELKKMNAGELLIIAKSDSKGKLSLDSEVLNGSLGLAMSNGEVVADIIDNQDKKKKIITKEHPREVSVEGKVGENEEISIFKKVMNVFRNTSY